MNWLAISELVRNFGLVIGGLIGGTIGIYLAWKRVNASSRQADASLQQAELARRDHVAELFNRAVSQLTDGKLEIRLGAVYTLRQIARDFSDLSDPTVELLSTYLRESGKSYGDSEPPVDVREIMKIIRDRLAQ